MDDFESQFILTRFTKITEKKINKLELVDSPEEGLHYLFILSDLRPIQIYRVYSKKNSHCQSSLISIFGSNFY